MSTFYTTVRALPSRTEVDVTALVMVHGTGEARLEELVQWAMDARESWPVPPTTSSSSSAALLDIGKPPASWSSTHQHYLTFAKELLRAGTCNDYGASYPVQAVLADRTPAIYTSTDQVIFVC